MGYRIIRYLMGDITYDMYKEFLIACCVQTYIVFVTYAVTASFLLGALLR